MTEISLVTESFNLAEGQSFEAFAATCRALTGMLSQQSAEILVCDASNDARVAALVATLPSAALLPSQGLGYDAQKNLAARTARGRYVVYLDGDCRPCREDWLDLLLQPLRDGRAQASGGTSFYDALSPTAMAMSIIDFGYTWERPDAALDCYAANNVAFTTTLRCEIPAVEEGMRCNCYAHTQELRRRGREILSVVDAEVLHEMPDVERERQRRGYDVAAACWVNPLQIESSALAPTDAALRWHRARFAHLDQQRLRCAPATLGITSDNIGEVHAEILRLRRLDLVGLAEALQEGERDGRNAEARATFNPWLAAQRLG